jgi:hypothetical protein
MHLYLLQCLCPGCWPAPLPPVLPALPTLPRAAREVLPSFTGGQRHRHPATGAADTAQFRATGGPSPALHRTTLHRTALHRAWGRAGG